MHSTWQQINIGTEKVATKIVEKRIPILGERKSSKDTHKKLKDYF